MKFSKDNEKIKLPAATHILWSIGGAVGREIVLTLLENFTGDERLKFHNNLEKMLKT